MTLIIKMVKNLVSGNNINCCDNFVQRMAFWQWFEIVLDTFTITPL